MPTVSVKIPQLGEGLREAYLVDVLKQPGDTVMRDEPLFTMETDKAVSEVESPFSGTVVKWLVEVDSVLEIGTEVAVIETQCTAPDTHQPRPHGRSNRSVPKTQPVTASAAAVLETLQPVVGLAQTAMSSCSPAPTIAPSTQALIPPKTRRHLQKHRLLDVAHQIETAGRKMTVADVDHYIQTLIGTARAPDCFTPQIETVTPPQPAPTNGCCQTESLTSAESSTTPTTDPIDSDSDSDSKNALFDLVPLPKTQIRLNYRLTQAASTCVPVTLVNQWNWAKIESARNITREQGGPTALAMACWCIASAAQIHERFRCSLTGDGKSYRVFKNINLGIAVSLENDELVTAVVRNAGSLSIGQFYDAYSEAIQLARNGVDQADESTTLMVSNIGNIGMNIGIPAIVAPAVATLAIGQPIDHPVPDGESFKFQRNVTATLSFDHRVANGIGAAAFLNQIRSAVETFELE